MRTVTIIGPGRVGRALTIALPRDKYRIEQLVARDADAALLLSRNEDVNIPIRSLSELELISSDLIFITTGDGQIADVAAKLVGLVGPGTVVVHTSGSLSSAILSPVSECGCNVGSLHPLVSISSPVLGAERFRGAYFCVEGNASAAAVGREIVTDLGGISFSVDTEKKALYHAAAVMACGHLVALTQVAIEMMSKCGLDQEFARAIVLPLIESTVQNLKEQEVAAALTGPFARADVATFERHIEILRKSDMPGVLELYLELGDVSLGLALKQGADPAAVNDIRERISMAKREAR